MTSKLTKNSNDRKTLSKIAENNQQSESLFITQSNLLKNDVKPPTFNKLKIFSTSQILLFISGINSMVFEPEPKLANRWPKNENSGIAAGGIWEFSIPDGMIKLGGGSCKLTITTPGQSFVHFFNAHVSVFDGISEYEIFSMEEWEGGFGRGAMKFDFLTFSDAEPNVGDVSILCQNDTKVPSGNVLLSSFPQDPFADSARGSLTAKDRLSTEIDTL